MNAVSAVDRPGAVRDGEALDVTAVAAFLHTVDPSLRGTPVVGQYRGGASNLTYLLSYADREFVLRRPPFGQRARGAHDMLREAAIMKALKPVYPLVPAVIATCDSPGVMDCSFYVMEPIRGIILRRDLPAGLDLTEAETRSLCLRAIDAMIALHDIDCKSAGLESIGRGEGYVARQIASWIDRYEKARTPDANDFATVTAWLKANMPARDSGACIIHNDFRFDNIVLDPQTLEVVGVLDWEMATIGDPLMELGNSLAYWVEANDEPEFLLLRRQPTHLPGMHTRREVIDYYRERTGRAAGDFDFYLVYGIFRLAAIVQQIYYRYANGSTKNPEFAQYVRITNYLERRCLEMIDGRTAR